MSDDQGKALLSATFVLAVALAVWSELHDNHRLPLPSRFIGIGLVWGTLGLVGPFVSYTLAGTVGAGMLLALYYQHFTSSNVGGIVGNGLAPEPGEQDSGANPPPGVRPLQTMPLQ
jgi:hypothetical protein